MYLLNLITDAFAMGPAPQGGGQGDPIMSLVASLLPWY